MAKEIQIVTDTAGQTLYAQVFRSTDGKVWNTAGTPAFEDYATANIADYDIALTEQGTASKIYMGTFPSGIAAGDYLVRVLIRAGGSPAETDALAGAGPLHWDGSTVIDVTTVHANLLLAMGATFNTSTDSLEAIRNQGDAAWVTATGFSTHSASDVWAVGTRTLTAGTNIQLPSDGLANVTAWTVAITGNITGDLSGSVGSVTGNVGGSVTSVGNIADAVWEEAVADHSGTAGSTAEALAAAAAGGGGGPSAADIADAVWDEATAGHTTAGTFGEQLKTDVDAILVDTAEIGAAGAGLTSLASAANLATVAGYLDTEIAAILADTNELQTDWANGGRLDLIVDAVLADTNELQTDWANGGRLDLILDARASQTSVDDLPTNAELATALAGADDATLAAIAALNNLSAAQVNAEVDAALADINLDHLMKIAVDTDFPTTVHLNSVLGHLADDGTSATFDRTTDSQEAIRNRGDSAWITATGFSTHSASDVWAVGTRILTAGTNIVLAKGTGVTGFNDLSTAQVNAEVDTAIADAALATAANLATVAGYLDTEVAAILEDTGTTIPAQIAALNNLSAAQVNSEVDAALADYDGPTNAEMVARTLVAANYATAANLSSAMGATFDTATDSLEAIRNRGDVAWVTATGFSTLDAAGVRTAVGLASANLDTQIGTLATQTSVNTINDFLDTEIAAIKSKTDSLTFTTANKVDAKLTSDGLDNIAITAPSAVATSFREMVVQLWRRFFKKTVRNATDGNIKTYADNGSTVITTQTYTSASGVDTIDGAS